MADERVVGGHRRIRPFNTKDTYPEQSLANDLAQAVVANNTVYLRGQVARTWRRARASASAIPRRRRRGHGQRRAPAGECGAELEHIVKCVVYLTDIRHREPVYRVLGERLAACTRCSRAW